jgi:CrcB protein
MLLVYLALGGVLGTLLRYGMGGWVHSWAGTSLPWGTLAINVLGSLILGFTMRASQSLLISPELRAFITIGFCGAFTTFSTYTYETVALMQKGEWLRALMYALGSLVVGLLAVIAGFAAAARLLRAGG